MPFAESTANVSGNKIVSLETETRELIVNSRKMRVFASLGTGILAIALLAGCGGSGTQSAETEESGPSNANSSDEAVTLEYWSWAPNIDKIVDIWNDQNPNIQVNVNTSVGANEIVAKLSAAKEAGNMPDVSNSTYEMLPNLIVNGIASDVTEGFGQYEDKVAEAAWNLVTFDGATYAVPQGTSPMFLFYRVDIFDELKLKPPVTWEEYADVARKIHEDDPKRFLTTFSAGDAQTFAALSQQAGGEWWSVKDGVWNVDINGEASQKVADYWQGLVDEGVIATFKTWTPEWQAALADGTLASWISAAWAPPLIAENAPDAVGKWGAVRMPQWDASAPKAGVLGGSSTIVTTGTDHPDEALEFAIWLNNSEEALTAFVDYVSVWPANLEGRNLPVLQNKVPEALAPGFEDFYGLAAEIDQETVPVVWGPNVALAFSTFNDSFSSAITSGGSFKEALDSVHKATEDDMKNLGFDLK